MPGRRWIDSVGAIACTIVIPAACIASGLLGRAAYRLVCPVGEAIDAVLFEIEEMTE